MAWLFLLLAAAFEVTFAMGMKYAEGFTRLWPSLLTLGAALAGVYFLTLAMRELPVSVAYPIWTAIGSLAGCVKTSRVKARQGKNRRGSGVYGL